LAGHNIGMKSFLFALKEILEIVLIAVLAVGGVRYFLVQPFLVNGSSMEPNFESGDYILINEISYRFREPQRGEVVVFHYPNNERTYFIKRVIGLPTERITIKNGEVKIFNKDNPKGFVLKENYLPSFDKTSGDIDKTLSPDEYFVMGDNRGFSFDSRQWGTLKRSEIVGIAWLRLWPFNKASAFESPAYSN